MTSTPRIMFTGVGAVCGAGLGVDVIWSAILEGRSAVAPIRQWDSSRWPARMAAEVAEASIQTLVEDRRLHKFISRTDMFGLYAAQGAIQQSGVLAYREKLEAPAVTRFNDRSGIFVGSGGGVYKNNYDFLPLITAGGGDLKGFGQELTSTVNPMWLLRHLPNNVLCYIGIRHGFKGTNACITNQCVSGVMAVAEAAAALRSGEADRAVAAGHDAPIEPETVLHYHKLGLLADDAVRPFDRDRRGTVFGEGAAAFVLETEEAARSRKVGILGEFLGSGCSTEGTGVVGVRPDGDGLSRAIELAIADAQVSREEVGLIVAHGNGTWASDASEANAIRKVFGDRPPPVTAFKWAYGHSIAASGAIDLAMALRALREGVVPGIPTLNSLDSALAPLPVSQKPQSLRGSVAVVACRGFGGMNAALVVRAGPVSLAQ